MKKYDCLIVGTGIAGQLVASKLINSGLEICILESGAETRNPSLDFLNKFEASALNFRKDFLNRVREVGGACNLWAGRMMRLSREDIEARPWLGLNGWPIEYEELESFYNQVDDLFGIVNSWNHKCKFPFPDHTYEHVIENARSVWAKKTPRFNVKSNYWKEISRSNHTDIFLNCTVINLEYQKNRDVLVNCIHGDANISFKSKYVVVASGGIENARILLDSKDDSGRFFNSMNTNIGHYFMDHPTYVTPSLSLVNSLPISTLNQKSFYNSTLKDGIKFKRKVQSENGLTNPYIEISMHIGENAEKAMANIVALYKSRVVSEYLGLNPADIMQAINSIYLMNPIEKFPHFVRQSYDYLFRKIRNNMIGDGIVFSHHIENLPSYQNYIKKLERKNKYGCSEIEINWTIGEPELKSSERLIAESIKYFKLIGVIDNNIEVPKINLSKINDASHHMGTTRMSSTSSDGVVDKNLRLWGVNSIFVAGSSVFPSTGHANPTYTIAALSIRLGEYLRKTINSNSEV